jgi:pimeloyl-ACP methyl ester carboxylesterase
MGAVLSPCGATGNCGADSLIARRAFRPPYPPATCKDDDALVQLSVPDFGTVNALHYSSEATFKRRRRAVQMTRADDVPVSEKSRGKLTILFSHGNGCDVSTSSTAARMLCKELGADVIVYDYPGYGGNRYMPSESAAFKAAEAAYSYALAHSAVSPENLVIFGHSLGTGPSVELARSKPCAALILQSPLRSAVRVVVPSMPFTLPFDIMANEDKIVDLRSDMPLYIMHGTCDKTIDISHGRALYRDAVQHMQAVTCWWPDYGHNNLELHEKYYERFGLFLRQVRSGDGAGVALDEQ